MPGATAELGLCCLLLPGMAARWVWEGASSVVGSYRVHVGVLQRCSYHSGMLTEAGRFVLLGHFPHRGEVLGDQA